MSEPIFDIAVKKNDGTPATLAEHKGDVLLIVNVASKCGLTPQYDALEKTYQRFHGQGFEVLAFPANNFMGQEPGTDEEIKSFCETKFNVTFPLYAKIDVVGEHQHPLYKALTTERPKTEDTGAEFRQKLAGYGSSPKQPNDILWNFEKFLVGRDGKIAARFEPDVAPDDARLVKAIETELAKPKS